VSAVVGGVIVHFLTASRERAAKRREILVRGKAELWKLLDKSNGLADESVGKLNYDVLNWEEISREIQLLGTDEQIKMVQEITVGIGKDVKVPYPELMKSLQNELRQELGMKKSKVPYFWTRIRKFDVEKIESKR
jgi:hypothetical protein